MRQIDVQVTKQSQVPVATALATLVAALDATSGTPLEEGVGCACTVSAPVGQTLTSGNMRCYVFVPCDITLTDNQLPTTTYRWTKYSALDFAVTAGQRDSVSGDKTVFTGVGKIIWLPDTIVLSGGTAVDVITYTRQVYANRTGS